MLSVEEEAIKKAERNSGGQQHHQRSTTPTHRTTMSIPDQSQAPVRKSSHIRLFALGLFFLFYLALGASIFSAIESPIEKAAMEELQKRKADFLQSHSCITESSLDDLMDEIVTADNRGVSIGRNGSSVPSWSFGQSFFFSSTVVTTIGYGHQTPLSPEGKFFCILYALIGIPMTMLLVTAVVDRLMMPVNLLLIWMNNTMGHLYSPLSLRLLHLFLIFLVIVVVLFLVPAALFTALEDNWGFMDAMYYCFISLTTVGLGDFIPGDTPGQHLRPLYKACTTIYLLIGVTSMMLLLTVFYSIPEFDVSNFFLMNCSSDKLNGIGNVSSLNEGGVSGVSGASAPQDSERIRLKAPGTSGPRYTQQINETNELGHSRTIVRARSRPGDDDSPIDEAPPVPGPSGRTRLR